MQNEAAADQIHIEQLEIFTHIGVPEKERSTSQRLALVSRFGRSRIREILEIRSIRQSIIRPSPKQPATFAFELADETRSSYAVLLYTAKHLLLKLRYGIGLVVSNFSVSKITKLP
jgi:hypothetical protein